MNKILIWLLVVMTITTTLARSGRDGQRRKKTMKPNKYSEKYDEKTIALEFDDECLKENGKDENEMMLELLSLYPCLSNKEVYTDGTVFRHHGKIKRTYMKITSDSSSNKKRGKANNEEFFLTEKNCLENSTDEIDWDDYCIEDISYDMTLYLEGICIDDVTNGIYYDLTKKADAWNLDMMDGKIDSRFKRPNIGALGSDNGIDIWILDSGIYKEHNEFYSGQIIDEVPSYTYTSKHGTNSASVAGGNHYGSSKGFYIHDYIVCRNSDGGCSFSDIDKGLQAVLAHMRKTGRRSIINMSIGSSGANNYASTQSYYESLFADINNAGGIIVVSAGNSNTDACNWWFSYSDKVVSVGAHDKNKKRSTFSNYGPCVDIYAPGTSVPAANSISDPTVVGYVSGTSFASPMMAGIIANLLYEDRTRTKDQIVSLLRSTANRYQITNCPSGYCYGFGYKCSILSANGIESEDDDEDDDDDDDGDEGDEGDQDDQNEYEEDYDHDDNIEGIEDFNQNNGIEDNGNIEGEVSSMGCCKTLRSELKRLEQYCSSLSIDDCLSGENIDYCFVDTQC